MKFSSARLPPASVVLGMAGKAVTLTIAVERPPAFRAGRLAHNGLDSERAMATRLFIR